MVSEKPIIETLASNMNITKTLAKNYYEHLSAAIQEVLLENGEVKLKGLGNLVLQDTKARKGVNPGTGEKIEIPASKKTVFKPTTVFKATVKAI